MPALPDVAGKMPALPDVAGKMPALLGRSGQDADASGRLPDSRTPRVRCLSQRAINNVRSLSFHGGMCDA
jgi:hypothetical protein